MDWTSQVPFAFAVCLICLFLSPCQAYTGRPYQQHRPVDMAGWSPKGQPGDPGLPGVDGLPGLPGVKGEMGDDGIGGGQSLQGERGDKGERGAPGLDGFPGQKGELGRDGRRGHKGEPGNMGLPGLPGWKGERGSCDCASISTTTRRPTTTRSIPTTEMPNNKQLVAFHGLAVNVSLTGDVGEVVKFTEVVTNEGGFFDSNTDNDTRFQITIPGLYAFYVTSVATGRAAAPLALLVNNDVVMKTGSRRSSDDALPMSSNHAIVRVANGDEVKLIINLKEGDNSDNLTSDITFSAFMIG